MQMGEGEIGGAERSVHTMYMAYTQSCAEHMRHRLRRTRRLETSAGWDAEKRREASTSRGGHGLRPASEGGWGGGDGFRRSGVEVNGIRQHARAKSEVQPPLQQYDSLYLLNLWNRKRHSWVSVKILKMPSNWPTFEGVFFSS